MRRESLRGPSRRWAWWKVPREQATHVPGAAALNASPLAGGTMGDPRPPGRVTPAAKSLVAANLMLPDVCVRLDAPSTRPRR